MRRLIVHPVFRPLISFLILLLTMHALKAQWHRLGKGKGKSMGKTSDTGVQSEETEYPIPNGQRIAVGHFMLGNTYPFQSEDWERVFSLAQDTSLDGLALNIGPEEWQLSQAQIAYRILSTRPNPSNGRPLKLFLSLDMNVLSPSPSELSTLVIKVISSGRDSQLKWDGKVLLSTFSGHSLGDDGWVDVLHLVEKGLGEEVTFWPAFFMPPEDFLGKSYVDGAFAWNNAWPMGNHTVNLDDDHLFLESKKPYMAAISPLFFTHYGIEGEFGWNKNWIYRSDDLLLPSRFLSLLSLPNSRSPSIVQLISMNDYGESHNIFPVMGAQPGSDSWTTGMDHEGLRWISKYFLQRWRDGKGEVEGIDEVKFVLWYRTKPAAMEAEDSVGRPQNADWAQDLINLFVIIPSSSSRYMLRIRNGPHLHRHHLSGGKLNLLTVPFVPGQVTYEILENEKIIIQGEGNAIETGGAWNFNMWSGGVF
ncbi:hypothetical protein J008_02942 [Cryptococcus neoformans]|nr:hypothetical protein J008_02942 [Cryptococcus neoformans var. grubii]OXM79552.1 hypothetical protein C364_03051 [Cryptococcus neoformans var. grubii Bt63]